jgi:hypothetical protein
MYNQFTDRYRFVEVEVIRAVPFWGRKIFAKERYSQQLFQKKEYVCTLDPYEARPGSKPASMRVYNGEAIYKINMRPQPIPWTGSFKTKDNFVRIYNFTLILKVSNPVIFAKGYSAGQDPVFLTIDEIHKALVKFGEEHEHDQLSKLKETDLEWNRGLADNTGIMVDAITKWILHEDMKRLETAEIEQETVKEKLRIQRETETDLIRERAEGEREALQHMYFLHRQLSNTAAIELRAILQERIRDAFESGQPIDQVAKETLDLLNALYKGIENFSYSNGAFDAQNGASSGVNGNSTGTQGGSSKTNGNVRGTSFEKNTSVEGDTMKDPAINIMPAINELMKKEPEDSGT